MYTYDPSGVPTWYVMSSCPVEGNSCSGDIYTVTGGKSLSSFWDGSAKIVTKVRNGTLTFADHNHGVFNFLINGVHGSKGITRQMFAEGANPPDIDYSDLWWNPAESGWGVGLTQEHETIFAVMFSYDDIDTPLWHVASNCKMDGNRCSGDLYQVTGGTKLATLWNAGNLAATKVGTV